MEPNINEMDYLAEKYGILITPQNKERQIIKTKIMEKPIEQEKKEERFEFKPNRSFEERCEIVRKTAITSDMTYEERLEMQKRRYGL